MLSDKFKNFLHLHFLVFIAGFTAILGELITIGSFELVWYRMVIAGILMLAYIKIRGFKLKVTRKVAFAYFGAGVLIALHWVTFFESIKQANVSIALAMFSTGAFFTSLLEPLIYKRKIKAYEIVLGIIVIFGVYLIAKTEIRYINGILLGLLSAVFSSWFAVLNGKFVETNRPSVIAIYEFASGIIILTLIIMLFKSGFNTTFFSISLYDFSYIFILASICTAYAFIAVIELMKSITPYTVVLTYNLEPVYGIILAILMFPASEIMGVEFYIGAVIILTVVFLNSLLTRKKSIST